LADTTFQDARGQFIFVSVLQGCIPLLVLRRKNVNAVLVACNEDSKWALDAACNNMALFFLLCSTNREVAIPVDSDSCENFISQAPESKFLKGKKCSPPGSNW
jgi:hypothetical protein